MPIVHLVSIGIIKLILFRANRRGIIEPGIAARILDILEGQSTAPSAYLAYRRDTFGEAAKGAVAIVAAAIVIVMGSMVPIVRLDLVTVDIEVFSDVGQSVVVRDLGAYDDWFVGLEGGAAVGLGVAVVVFAMAVVAVAVDVAVAVAVHDGELGTGRIKMGVRAATVPFGCKKNCAI